MASPVPARISDAVRRMNGTRRFAGLALILGSLAVIVVTSRWATGPTYVTLMRDVDLNAISGVTDNLTKNGVKYRLGEGGNEVLVSMDDVARARVMLAKDNLPANGKPGLELFDKPSWSMTDFTQRVTYRRALEGELSRTIGTLRGIDRAQVHLALPESSPLRRLERPAEAAVVLSLKPGVVLSPDVVQGIAYIVSNSVEQLPADNVAIMDDSGKLLSMPADANGVSLGMTTRQLDLQHGIEKQLSEKVEGMLATLVGPAAARVQVAARLNFDQSEHTVETYDPDGQVLQTEQKSEATPGGNDSASGSQTIISNQYQNSKRVEHTVGSTGSVSRLTVAVLVDEKALSKEGAKAGQSVEAQIARLEEAVKNAVGMDSARGDRLTMVAMPFDPAPANIVTQLAADSSKPHRDTIVMVERVSRPVILLVAVVLAFVLGWRLLKPLGASLPAGALAGAGGGASLPDGAHDTFQRATSATLPRDRGHADTGEPAETAAQVIRSWMSEA
jgi:flagellar M-ring protein FliF